MQVSDAARCRRSPDRRAQSVFGSRHAESEAPTRVECIEPIRAAAQCPKLERECDVRLRSSRTAPASGPGRRAIQNEEEASATARP